MAAAAEKNQEIAIISHTNDSSLKRPFRNAFSPIALAHPDESQMQLQRNISYGNANLANNGKVN